jgi:maleylpyruvate isomerase
VNRASLPRSLAWMRQGTELFLRTMAALDDDELAEPTALPGWSRRHVVAHVGFNARALQRLVEWARTGRPHPMYTSAEQRASEIDAGATWDARRLRRLVIDSAADLAADLDTLNDERWHATVVTAQGRSVPATEIPWMRTREVAIHAVDLGGSTTFEDLPDDLCEAIIDDVVTRRSGQRRDPAIVVHTLTGRTWTVDGPADQDEGDEGAPAGPISVTGSPAQLARWLTGRGAGELRTAGDDRPPPALTPWL